jgi:hypothetical protein
MAVDSIMAKPTNNVLVIVGAASGCCAIELNADATDLPSLNAGNMHPMPVVRPEVTIDATAIRVVLSILITFYFIELILIILLGLATAAAI